MSALGQCAPQNVMSASPPKAHARRGSVRFPECGDMNSHTRIGSDADVLCRGASMTALLSLVTPTVSRHTTLLTSLASCAYLLTACAGISTTELGRIGERVARENINFGEVYT